MWIFDESPLLTNIQTSTEDSDAIQAGMASPPKPNARTLYQYLVDVCIGSFLLVVSCSLQPNLPTVLDDRVQALVRTEAAQILSVNEELENFAHYQFLLSDFPREDILGMSVGKGRIYINYQLASLALTDFSYYWLLRQTVAHEIAHETAGHANQKGATGLNAGPFTGAAGGQVGLPWYVRIYNYSAEKELEADLKGLGYWNKLGWDCRIWVRILEDFQRQNYNGDVFHPTDKRLHQARSVCGPPAESEGSPVVN